MGSQLSYSDILLLGFRQIPGTYACCSYHSISPCMCVCLSVSVCLLACLSAYLSVCMYVRPSVRLSVCLPVSISLFICMLAWLRNVNIAILVSHVSWNVLTSSTLLAQPCICTIVLNGHAHISNLHCQFLCCCALLQVEISLKTHPSHYLSLFLSFTPTKK